METVRCVRFPFLSACVWMEISLVWSLLLFHFACVWMKIVLCVRFPFVSNRLLRINGKHLLCEVYFCFIPPVFKLKSSFVRGFFLFYSSCICVFLVGWFFDLILFSANFCYGGNTHSFFGTYSVCSWTWRKWLERNHGYKEVFAWVPVKIVRCFIHTHIHTHTHTHTHTLARTHARMHTHYPSARTHRALIEETRIFRKTRLQSVTVMVSAKHPPRL